MAYKITNLVFESEQVEGVDKAVLLALAFFANEKTGACWPSISTICRISGWSRTAVKKALANLIKQEFVSVLGTKPSKFGVVNMFKVNQGAIRPSLEEAQPGEGPAVSGDDPVFSRPSTGSSRGDTQGATRPQNLLLNREEEQAIDPAIPEDRSTRFAETQGDPVNPKEQPRSLWQQIEEDGDVLPQPPVHSPAPQVRVIPRPPIQITSRRKGHAFGRRPGDNGATCVKCKMHYQKWEKLGQPACSKEEADEASA